MAGEYDPQGKDVSDHPAGQIPIDCYSNFRPDLDTFFNREKSGDISPVAGLGGSRVSR
jgi:hypothetical protein